VFVALAGEGECGDEAEGGDGGEGEAGACCACLEGGESAGGGGGAGEEGEGREGYCAEGVGCALEVVLVWWWGTVGIGVWCKRSDCQRWKKDVTYSQ